MTFATKVELVSPFPRSRRKARRVLDSWNFDPRKQYQVLDFGPNRPPDHLRGPVLVDDLKFVITQLWGEDPRHIPDHLIRFFQAQMRKELMDMFFPPPTMQELRDQLLETVMRTCAGMRRRQNRKRA